MKLRAPALLVTLVLAALASPAGAETGGAPELSRGAAPGVSRVEARWPGTVVAVAAVTRPEGGRSLFVLATPAGDESAPRELYRLDSAGSGEPMRSVKLRDGLSAGLDALDAVDLDGDGRMELLAGEPRRIYCLGSLQPESAAPGGELAWCELATREWIDLRAPDQARLRAPNPERRLFATAEVGRVRFFRAEAGRLEKVAEERLPVEATREHRGLRLVTPPLAAVATGGAPTTWVAGPQAIGTSRLRLLRLEPEAAPAARRSEAWCRLPGPEKVESAATLAFDGTPCLVALTARSDKLSVFEKAKLRLFPLAADRTRAGRAPSFVAETGISRWRRATLAARDLDGDGHDDLVILGPLGLRGEKLGVQVHAGLGGGRFQTKGESVEIEGGDREAIVVDDLSGDGRADLLLFDAERLALHLGRSPGGPPFAERPHRTLELAPAKKGEKVEVAVSNRGVRTRSLAERPELLAVDLDGDGRAEIVMLAEEEGHGLLRLVTFD